MTDLISRLKQLSSAEEFLDFFGIRYEEKVVHVNRLHILKRFYQYLRRVAPAAELAEVELFRIYREQLAQAYQDFVRSTPAQEKVFKVFEDAQARQVSFDGLRDSLAARRVHPGV
jgi:nitrogenase-stabilizing/protective protein